jgi:hypothetical protein
MKQTDDPRGMMVLVHPELAEDPAGKQNEFGAILAADFNTDEMLVCFTDGNWGLYPTDALLVLKESEELFRLLETNEVPVTEADRKLIHAMALVLLHDFEEAPRICLKICRQNPAIRELAMESLPDALDRDQQQDISR